MKIYVKSARQVLADYRVNIESSDLSEVVSIAKSHNVAMLTTSRGKYNSAENEKRIDRLAGVIARSGYGYVELEGGWNEGTEDDPVIVTETSFAVYDRNSANKATVGKRRGRLGIDNSADDAYHWDSENYTSDVTIDDDGSLGDGSKKFAKFICAIAARSDQDSVLIWFSELQEGRYYDPRTQKYNPNDIKRRFTEVDVRAAALKDTVANYGGYSKLKKSGEGFVVESSRGVYANTFVDIIHHEPVRRFGGVGTAIQATTLIRDVICGKTYMFD